MTDRDLARQAVEALKKTTVSYPQWLKTTYTDRSKTNWGVALAALDKIGNNTLIFEDTFDGDLSKWDLNWFGGSGPVNSAENAAYASRNLAVVGGNLEMKLTAEPIFAKRFNLTVPFTGALLTTQGKFTFRPPYRIEARMWLPASPDGRVANWPAFWTNGTGKWPETGENDVMEGLGGDCAYHYHSPSGAPGKDVDTRPGWRVFASEVKGSPLVATYFYDGIPVGSISEGIVDAPHYLILQHSISDHHPETDLAPARVLVDYVRVWRLEGDGA